MKSERCREGEGSGSRVERLMLCACVISAASSWRRNSLRSPGHLVELPSELVALSKRDVAFKEESIAIGHCRR
jgi:hypothetical protein